METRAAKRRRLASELIEACRRGVQTLQEAVDFGVDLRAGGNAALREACANGHVEVLDRLLAAGLGVEDLRAENNYAVRYACENGHAAILDRLLAAGLGVEDLRAEDNYAVREACRYGNVEVLERIVVYFGSIFHKDWVREVLSTERNVSESNSDGLAKWRQRVLVAMRVHGVLPAAGRRSAVVVQRRFREFLLAPARVFDPDAGAHRRAALGLEDSYRAMASGRVH